MSLGQELAPHLPFLRRYARALTGSQAHGDAFVRVDDFAAALAASPEWQIEVCEKRPRPPGAASAAHHVDDVVLRAHRTPAAAR